MRFLQRKRKVDAEAVEMVEEELKRKIWSSMTDLGQRVNQRLGRKDLTVANIEAALEQIPCMVIRQELIPKWEEGVWHPKEQTILEEVLEALEGEEQASRERAVELLRGVGIKSKPFEIDEVIQKSQWEAVEELLEVDRPGCSLSLKTQQMVFARNLYYWSVPLSRIGRWLGRGKSTIYGRVIGLALALWSVVGGWVENPVKGSRVYVDEVGLKIRKKWHYWYLALDDQTGLPLLGHLLGSRSEWACRWFMVKLKAMGLSKDDSYRWASWIYRGHSQSVLLV